MTARARRQSPAAHHVEWLRLIDVTGPFLSLRVLVETFPQGLDSVDSEVVDRLRAAIGEWEANRANRRPDPALHAALIRYVLLEVLEYPAEYVADAQRLDPALVAPIPEHRVTLRPDLTVGRPGERPTLLLSTVPPSTTLQRPTNERGFHASPAERMRLLLRGTGVMSGIVTNGAEWLLVHVPSDRSTSFVTWQTALLVEERITLRALRSLLGVRRLFGVPDSETLDGLFGRSRDDEREVTDQLGAQALRAVELLVDGLDASDRANEGRLLAMVPEARLYEAALVVVMRLIFLLAAEARRLLPEEGAWIEGYALTPLRAELQENADRDTLQTLERRFDAWPRLLATFRAVHGGVTHGRIRMPGYGGGLFDPTRYPFLESAGGVTPRISNRTILHVLDALETLEVEVPGGRERRPLSFAGVGVEQIGHVYERLLDHTAVRATAPAVGLAGTADRSGDIALELLEAEARAGNERLLDLLVRETGRSQPTLERGLRASPEPARMAALAALCEQDEPLIARIRPFLGLVRDDAYGAPVIYLEGRVYVTESPGRRTSGAHYTPPILTEPIVEHALEPVVYRGPAEGKPREEWALKSAAEILELKFCDVAMGSGAFLAAACRYLAARLVEAWDREPERMPAGAGADAEERTLTARRLVAERCIYGVDVNPLAVEIAKVSLWLVTLRRDRPFTFLDHALRRGDSLVGITDAQALAALSLRGQGGLLSEPAARAMRETLADVTTARTGISETDAVDLREVEAKAAALERVRSDTRPLRTAADLVIATEMLGAAGRTDAETLIELNAASVAQSLTGRSTARLAAQERVASAAAEALTVGRAPGGADLIPFHWVLEFPEVFLRSTAGFDAVVGNPPFLGGKKISGLFGDAYREYLVRFVARGRRASADLVAYFFLRASELCRPGGAFGLVATNSVAQGDTREAGLDQLVERGWSIFGAVSSARWPGEAALHVSQVLAFRGNWHGVRNLDGRQVAAISSSLSKPSRVAGKPFLLAVNRSRAHYGVVVLGDGFLLQQHEAEALLARNPRNRDVLFPYLIAEDLTSRPDQAASRWAIDFHDWALADAGAYPDCLDIVRRRVLPHRSAVKRKAYRERWWQFAERQETMRQAIRRNERVLVAPMVAKYWSVCWVPNGWIYSMMTDIFAFDDEGHAAVLSSTFHDAWARKYSGTLETRLRYSLTDCFMNFPFPDRVATLDDIGSAYLNVRKEALLAENQGLTTVYNRVHERPDDRARRIEELRRLRRELDRRVADSYGWTDLVLDHEFRDTPLGLRYTLSDALRTEALDRLLELNHRRHAEEQAVAATAQRSPRRPRKKPEQSIAEAEPLPWRTG